jgi:dipeptidyl aminopeptidase/acylaminoacyl peptidase
LEYRVVQFEDWHPVRRDVLVTTRSGDLPQLHRVRIPGGRMEAMTSMGALVRGGLYQPPRGEHLLVISDWGGGEAYQFDRLDVGEGRLTTLTDGRSRYLGPRWSRSGAWLAYTSTQRNGVDTDLYVMDPRRPDEARLMAAPGGSGWLVLDGSPDERRWLVLSWVSITESYLHEFDMATGVRRLLTPVVEGGVAYGGGRYLPDGRSLISATDRGGEFRTLRRLELATGEWSSLGVEGAGDVEQWDLSMDGRWLGWMENRGGASVGRVLDLRTGEEKRVPALPVGMVTGLRWHPRRAELGGTLRTAKQPGEVWSYDARTGGWTRWTEGKVLRRGWVPVEPERMEVRGADGLALSGWLYRPKAERHAGPRPVLISFHGGPEGQARPGNLGRWNYLVEELGVAVLFPNVRGSAGFGRTFLSLDDGRKRGEAVRDIEAFLDGVVADAGLDGKRVAVQGASYGGYLALMALVEYGDRLRCGVSVAGIARIRTFLEATQEYRRDQRRVEYGDERDPGMAAFLDSISPLTQAARIGRPVLVAQGANDPRVVVSEAEALVEGMREAGVEVGYVLARDEGHGFVGKANGDFLFLAMAAFLEKHLGIRREEAASGAPRGGG